MNHFPGGAAGYAQYGISSYNTAGTSRNRFVKEIHVRDDSGNDSVSVTNDNY